MAAHGAITKCMRECCGLKPLHEASLLVCLVDDEVALQALAAASGVSVAALRDRALQGLLEG